MTPQMAKQRLVETLGALHDVVVRPALRRAEVAFALSCTADTAFTVTLGVVAFREGGAGAVGLVALLRLLPSALGSPILTTYADRIRPERVLSVASIVRAAASAVIAPLLANGAPAAGIYALAVVVTISATVFRPVHSALLPLLCTGTAELTSANVVRGVLEALAALAGPTLAGVMLVVASPTSVFVAVAVLSALTLVPLAFIESDRPSRPVPPSFTAMGHETKEGVRAVVEHRDLRLIFGLGFAQTFVRGALNVFIVVVALELLDTADSGVAALAAALGVGGLVGAFGASLLVGSRRLGAWLAIALALWGAPIAGIGIVPSEIVAFTMLALVGLANAVIDVPLFTLPVRLASDDLLARAFGVLEALVALGVGFGSVATPGLIGLFGLRASMVIVGLSLPLLGVACWRALRMLDQRLSVRDDEIRVLRSAPMLALLPVPIIEYLAARVRRRTVPAGTTLFEQGSTGSSLFVVISGQASVIGGDRVLATVGPGDAFGEVAVVNRVPRTATVRACADLDVFELERDDVLSALGKHRASLETAHAVVASHLANYRPMVLGT